MVLVLELCLSASDDDLVLLKLLLLLDHGLDESWLVVQIDPVLILKVVHVVVQEGLVRTQFLPDGHEADLVH